MVRIHLVEIIVNILIWPEIKGILGPLLLAFTWDTCILGFNLAGNQGLVVIVGVCTENTLFATICRKYYLAITRNPD